ncbi:serine protease persephone-like [Nymphalis io]|uniref:serine protease persephone-like n=1 Tax=Inachis io TaxID=171585 RepID=UPI002169AD08|nr:serine protease persephone-like [Nymphalis io]XP_050350995.1 serine protease persephone-like [Nymphalis io]
MDLKEFIFLILIHQATIEGSIGEDCEPSHDILDGACKLVTDCEDALRYIKQTRKHPFRRCGFSDDLEIVCCPKPVFEIFNSGKENSSRDLRTTTMETDTLHGKIKPSRRIADKECEKIIESTIPPLGLYIIGGDLAGLGEFPHMVALGYEMNDGYKFICGGSLVSTSFVITAAHCLDNLERIEPSIVRAGVIEIGGTEFNKETDIRIKEIIKHPAYIRSAKYHDLALLRLERPFEVSVNLNAICLYTNKEEPSVALTVTGWGTTSISRDLKSSKLLKADVFVVPTNTCKKSYQNWLKLPREIIDEQICAGDPKGFHDACQGDSGGPLQGLTDSDGYYRLVGVISFGRGCGSTLPGVYTRITKYLDWIESVVWPQSKT